MAVNPLARTGDQNTLKMSDLLRIPVRDRVTAAKTDSSFIQMILNSLTPIEVAKAFPSYYRDAIPDVSNFVTKNIEAKLAAGGMTWHQTRGGEQGTARPEYTGEAKTSPNTKPAGVREASLDEIKDTLEKKNIDVDEIYDLLSKGSILQGDKRIQALKNLPADKLEKMGFRRINDDNGKTLIQTIAIEEPTEKDLSKGTGSVGTGMELPIRRRKELVFNAVLQQLREENFEAKDLRGVAAMLAGQPEQESSFNPTAEHDKDPKTGQYTGYGIYGARLDRRDKMFAWLEANGYAKNDLVGQARYMAHEAVNDPTYRKYMNKMSQMELTKMAKEDPGAFREVMLGFTINFEGPKYPKSGLENRIRGATDTFDMEEENIFALNPEAYVENQKKIRKDNAARILYEQESPTSSEAVVDKTGKTKVLYDDASEQFKITANMKGVDPRLAEIAKVAAEEFPLRVRLFSGKRGDGAHGKGLAIDTQLFDEAGVPIASYQTTQTANIYALWAEKMREVQQRLHPELDDEFVWGGAFSQLEIGKYGAADWMDFRIGKHGGVTPDNMKSYQFGKGFTNPNYVADAENDFLGIGNRPVTLDDLKLLEGFRLTKEQQEIQRKIAVRGNFKAGL